MPLSPSRLVTLLVLVLVPACTTNPVRVSATGSEVTLLEVQESALTQDDLSATTWQVLGTLGLVESFQRDPMQAPGLICRDAFLVPPWARALAGSEIYYRQARLQENSRPEQASGLFLQSCLTAYQGLFGVDQSSYLRWHPGQQLLLELYNRALAHFLTLQQDLRGHPGQWFEVEGPMGTYELVLGNGPETWDPSFFDEFLAAENLTIEGFRHRHRFYGLGAPLVAVRENAPPVRESAPHFPPEGIVYPATALLLPADEGVPAYASTRLSLVFRNPWKCDLVPIGEGATVPLAADLTAPYAVLLARARLHEIQDQGFFDANAPDHQGLYLMTPYDPDKVPLVLVHGLWSSPLTWRELTNEVWGDPQLRQRYQVWHYLFPTATPILDGALGLRTALRDLRRRFDPEDDDPAMQNMVVIGHSMGGLLSKILVQDSEDSVWSSRFQGPLDDLGLEDDVATYARDLFFYEPEPYIKRVIFVAVPHRGSDVADSLLGRFGSSLMTVPERLERFRKGVAESFRRQGQALDFGVPTSVEVLSPTHPVLSAVADLPITDIPFHSIIGDVTENMGPGGDDGVVPYESSHLDGAESELVVPHGHDAHTHPLAIAEVRRILRMHCNGVAMNRGLAMSEGTTGPHVRSGSGPVARSLPGPAGSRE